MTMTLFSGVRIAALATAAMVLAAPAGAETLRAYIGTYTMDPSAPRPTGRGEGIYVANVDSVTGVISNVKLAAKDLSPSWLTLSADRKFLYAVNEIESFGPNKSGSVTAYAVGADGGLKKLNTVDSGGSIPCYISFDPSKKFVLVANYTGGTFSVIRLKADGSLGETTDIVKPAGPMGVYQSTERPPGMQGSKQEHGSRGHMILPDPSGQYIVGADAGRDQIFVWKLNPATGKLNQVSVTKTLAGSAPRHFAFSHDGRKLYQLFEQTSRLGVYDFKDGKLTMVGKTVSSLPNGYAGANTGSELLISKNGKNLYFGNRTQDSIGVFAIGADGGATRIANVSTEGNNPRSLTLDPSEKFIYSLNQGADNITSYTIGANGVPKFTGKYVPLGTPAIMVFAK
jgi:6-phosphogluconolactonase (cycloisomerase 2 family)